MASTIISSLTCTVCLGYFKDPKQLICGHTFCKACLVSIYKSKSELTCPICRQNTTVPTQGVSKLPTNLTLKRMLEDLQTGDQLSAFGVEEDEPGNASCCPTCEKHSCSSCHKLDVSSVQDTGNGEHEEGKINVYSKKPKRCFQHPGDTLAYYCKTCKKGVCFTCRVFGCDKFGHNIEDKHEIENNLRGKIVREIIEHEISARKNSVSSFNETFTKDQTGQIDECLKPEQPPEDGDKNVLQSPPSDKRCVTRKTRSDDKRETEQDDVQIDLGGLGSQYNIRCVLESHVKLLINTSHHI